MERERERDRSNANANAAGDKSSSSSSSAVNRLTQGLRASHDRRFEYRPPQAHRRRGSGRVRARRLCPAPDGKCRRAGRISRRSRGTATSIGPTRVGAPPERQRRSAASARDIGPRFAPRVRTRPFLSRTPCSRQDSSTQRSRRRWRRVARVALGESPSGCLVGRPPAGERPTPIQPVRAPPAGLRRDATRWARSSRWSPIASTSLNAPGDAGGLGARAPTREPTPSLV